MELEGKQEIVEDEIMKYRELVEDEIMKYRELVNEGIITEEEFSVKEEELLFLIKKNEISMQCKISSKMRRMCC